MARSWVERAWSGRRRARYGGASACRGHTCPSGRWSGPGGASRDAMRRHRAPCGAERCSSTLGAPGRLRRPAPRTPSTAAAAWTLGERAGTSVGSPSAERKRAMFLGSVTMATSFIRPLQAGHSRTSIANVRRKSSARFVDRPIAATLAFRSGVFVCLRRLLWLRRARSDALARQRGRLAEASTPAYLTV
jgi:hypothetical protein